MPTTPGPPAERCREHGLALGPGGRCVLCRRSLAPEASAGSGRWFLIAFSAGLLALTAWGLKKRLTEPPPSSPLAPNGLSAALHVAAGPRDARGLNAEQRARGALERDSDFLPANESYELVAPLDADRSLGLLVWISANPSGALPNPSWQAVLAKHGLIWLAANRSGNDRSSSARMGLAVDAVALARTKYSLDSERIFIGGFSGGAKAAFHTQLYYPDIFRGALLACGLDYFRDIPARSAGEGKTWFKRFGVPRDLAQAKGRPVFVVTGSADMNLAQISDVHAALGEDGFPNVEVLEIPGLGHEKPPADAFSRALDWLETH